MNIQEVANMELGPNQSVLAQLDQSGDTKVIWDRTKVPEVEAARATYERLKAAGYSAYSVKGKDGEKGEVLHTFDEKAERIIMAPRMVGG